MSRYEWSKDLMVHWFLQGLWHLTLCHTLYTNAQSKYYLWRGYYSPFVIALVIKRCYLFYVRIGFDYWSFKDMFEPPLFSLQIVKIK